MFARNIRDTAAGTGRMRIVCVLLIAACGHAPPREIDYAEARRSFHTRLLREGPSPQAAEPVPVAEDAHEVIYTSGALQLRAWVSNTSGAPKPAIVYVHGASKFRADHWASTQPLRDAGFVVMTPILRSENGSPGAYSLFYDEVADVVAAAEALARLPGVDPTHIYLAGNSNGGTLVMLAAMTSSRFRAAAALSGLVDASAIHGDPIDVPFDQTNPEEYRMRSAIRFPGSFKCPVRIYYGAEEYGTGFVELAQRARAAGRDVEAVRVPGDHDTMKAAALPLVIELFHRR